MASKRTAASEYQYYEFTAADRPLTARAVHARKPSLLERLELAALDV
jgi:hypothetical protein